MSVPMDGLPLLTETFCFYHVKSSLESDFPSVSRHTFVVLGVYIYMCASVCVWVCDCVCVCVCVCVIKQFLNLKHGFNVLSQKKTSKTRDVKT